MAQYTDDQRQDFLDNLSRTGVIAEACAASGIPRSAVESWKRNDPEFVAAFEEALEDAADTLESEATRRAVQGVTRRKALGSGDKMEIVEEVHHSDALLMFLLKARRPDRFADRSKSEISGPGGKPIETNDTSAALRVQALLDEAKRRKEQDAGEDDLFA